MNRIPIKPFLAAIKLVLLLIPGLAMAIPAVAHGGSRAASPEANARRLVEQGRQIFRHDTFGNEDFWSGQLRLNEAIAGAANGGAGPGLSPRAALDAGLKVDRAALPKALQNSIRRGNVNLDDPAVTVELLKLDAVVGVAADFSDDGLFSIGITCALCHSTVDDSLAPGIGHRRDGWANRDLNVGAVIALSPSLAPFSTLLGVSEDDVRAVLNSWGPGRFDATLLLDGKAFRPDGKTAAVLLPPAFGLAGVNLHTWTGWGAISHWNALVANLEMQGKGTFYDPRLNDAAKFPIAAANGFAEVRNEPDLVTPRLAALQLYQLALPVPAGPRGSYNRSAAKRGEALFAGKAQCAACHVPPLYTEPGWNLHTPEEIGIDDFQSSRSPTDRYRTSPLRGLWTHAKGGFYHDGRFAELSDVINHYDAFLGLGLTDSEKLDLIDFLKSL
jgi:cytochrome c5